MYFFNLKEYVFPSLRLDELLSCFSLMTHITETIAAKLTNN